MSLEESAQGQVIADRDPERFRESLLVCTSALRLTLGRGADADTLAEQAQRFRSEAEGLAIPGLRRCAESLGQWLASPGGLGRRHRREFAGVAHHVVGLLEQCVDAALLDAPAEQMDPLFASIKECCEADRRGGGEAEGEGPEGADGGLLESFADEGLDELDRCEELLMRAEIDGVTQEVLAAVVADLATVVAAGEALAIADLDPHDFARQLSAATDGDSAAAWIDGLLACVDSVRYAVEVACEAAAPTAGASIPVAEFLKRLRRGCRDHARALGGQVRVDIDVDVMARVRLSAAENFYSALARFAAAAVSQALREAPAGEAPSLRLRASVEESQLHFEIEDDAVDQMVAGETIQSLDARRPLDEEVPLHPYRRGYVNVIQVLVD